MTVKNHVVSVCLTPRQHAALRSYTASLGMSMSAYIREQLVSYIPNEHWGREKPPPGQLTIEVEEEQPDEEDVEIVRFVEDDPGGLWKRGELAVDLGQEHPGVPIWLLRKENGELLSLTDPHGRGLIDEVGFREEPL